MLQRISDFLANKEILTPTRFLFILLLVLSLIIVLGQFFHQSLQEEMAGQFNKQQLLLSREVALNIEGFVDRIHKNLRVISQLPNIDHVQTNKICRSAVESISLSLQNEALVTIRILDQNGIIRYDSAYPGREMANLSDTDYFKKARLLPKNERLVTDLLEIHDPGQNTKEFIVAVPIYTPNFSGVVLAVLSMDGITQRFLAPIKSGSSGYAWMIDSDGTLLYHPTQPQMVGKNLYQADKSCFSCHKTFDMEKKMIEGREEKSGNYEAPGGENKLAAYYKLPLSRKTWIVVVTAPYSEVIGLMRKSRLFYSLLIVSIFITTLAASGTTIVSYKKKIAAEEKARHLEDHRRLEREIEIQKDYLESIVEQTKTNLIVLDKNLIIQTVNTAQAATMGLPKHEVIGKPFFSLFPAKLAAYDGIQIESIFLNALNGHSFELRDYCIKCISDSPLYLTMNISPLLINGRDPGVLITSSDVTKRVQLEEALKRYTVELEDKVDRGTATAKKLEQQILHSEKLAALGRLAAGVAHEIGNPLTSISTFAQLLREMATDEFTQSSLDVINNHIQRIADIVRRMATFARADSLNIKKVRINDALNATLDLMRLDKRMKSSVEITVSLHPDLPVISIDEGQISQVFINIIINALDAMPDKGTLSVATRLEKDDQDKNVIVIAITDTGSGIAPEDLEKIFDPFYTTKEVGKGTGLGLSLSYDIVKRFNGDIKVESSLGKGTTFSIILPVDPGEN